jgi:hypothetical protein
MMKSLFPRIALAIERPILRFAPWRTLHCAFRPPTILLLLVGGLASVLGCGGPAERAVFPTTEALAAPPPSPKQIATPVTTAPAPSPEAGLLTSDSLTTDQLKRHFAEAGVARLKWTTQSEKNNFGFWVVRANKAKGDFVQVNKVIIMGAGNSSTPNNYVFQDLDVKVGHTYYYRIDSISMSGEVEPFSPVRPFTVNRLYLGGAPPGLSNRQDKDHVTTASATAASEPTSRTAEP